MANVTAGTVAAFSIGSDGVLSLAGTVASGNGVTTEGDQGAPVSVTVDPAGQHAYVVNFIGSVSAFSIGADGALTLLVPWRLEAATTTDPGRSSLSPPATTPM